MSQQELQEAPSDAISSVCFSPSGRYLLVSSWDRKLYLYQHNNEGAWSLSSITGTRAPVLDTCWGTDDDSYYIVGLDQDVRRLRPDEADGAPLVLSTHGSASNKVAYSREHNVIISTSWDGTMHVHNLAETEGRSFIRVALKAKPFALALTDQRAVVAMAERYISVYDIRALKMLSEQTDSSKTAPDDANADTLHIEAWQERESSLRFMTRAVTTIPDGAGFVTSSIEGRVGVDWFDPQDQAKTYAFKCHRQTSTAVGEDGQEASVDVVYPVNALAFSPTQPTAFVTGGGDGVIAVWDAAQKRRIRLYPKLPATIAAVDFSPDGKYLAIGVSPGFEDGQEDVELDRESIRVYVREIGESELKGKGGK